MYTQYIKLWLVIQLLSLTLIGESLESLLSLRPLNTPQRGFREA
jgi:hypothetical protein